MSSIFIRNAVDQMIFTPCRCEDGIWLRFQTTWKKRHSFRTLVPVGKTTAVYIIDLDRELRDKISQRRRSCGARLTYQTGDADLFGDDIREKAKVKFEQEIKDYETKNPNLPPTCDVKKR